MAASMIEDMKLRFRQGGSITRLIMINVIIHIAIALVYVPVFLFMNKYVSAGQFDSFISEWFWFPSDWRKIPFRLWTIFSYMFLHANFWHLFSNMLVLYIFGVKLSNLMRNDQIFPIYFWGGIVGALFFAIGFNVFPAFSHLASQGQIVGASAGVMAVVFAAATINPTGTFMIPFINKEIELRYVALLWAIYNVIVIPGGNAGGALAHLGGALMGWYFVRQLRKGIDLAAPVNKVIDSVQHSRAIEWIQRGPKRSKNYDKAKATKKVKTSTNTTKTPTFKSTMKVYKGSARSDYYGNEYGRSFIQKYSDMAHEDCLNTILEKIKHSGYDSLSEDERSFLHKCK